jgi:hypothetical protein
VAFVVSILGTIFSLLVFAGLGIVFLVIWAIRKSRRNRPPTTFPGQPGAPSNQIFPPPPPYNPGPNPGRPQDR